MTPAAVLVVEDERIIAKGIEKRLKGLGYQVAGSVATGEDAVRAAAELRPDIILMDINLGAGMDGVEAAAIIRAREHVPVVFLTAFSDDATIQRAKLTEPFGYVLKPYEDKDLQTAIEIGLYKHRAERRVQENEQWLAATLGSIGDGVIATDAAGRVRFLNALAERLTGWAQADALGRDVGEVFRIVTEGTRRPVPNPVFEALEHGRPAVLAADTVLVDRAGGERPIDDSAAPIRDAGGRVSGAVLVFRDVTERRRLEAHLRQAQKMEAVGRLAGGIAHDFNNIMTVITGFSEVLLSDDLPAEQRREFLRDIAAAGARAAALTQQITAFGRKQILVPCVLDPNAVVRRMEAMIARLVGPHVRLETDLAPDLGRVKADPTQIGQVLLNLAANARDAMPQPGGRLRIATANVDRAAPPAGHPEFTPGRYALIAVTDTGAGIPADVLAHLFEPFFTTKGVGQGTGLGLATVHGIVNQSGGHVEVSSAVGAGTTFRVYLPVCADPAPPAPREGRAARGVETILLVEDAADVRQMTKLVLTRAGYTVLDVAHGPAAIALAETYREPIHLLLTDVVMPDQSGRELAARLVALRPGLRALFMSGFTEDAAVHPQVEEGASEFLHKPFALAALTQKVRAALDAPVSG